MYFHGYAPRRFFATHLMLTSLLGESGSLCSGSLFMDLSAVFDMPTIMGPVIANGLPTDSDTSSRYAVILEFTLKKTPVMHRQR